MATFGNLRGQIPTSVDDAVQNLTDTGGFYKRMGTHMANSAIPAGILTALAGLVSPALAVLMLSGWVFQSAAQAMTDSNISEPFGGVM